MILEALAYVSEELGYSQAFSALRSYKCRSVELYIGRELRLYESGSTLVLIHLFLRVAWQNDGP